MNFVKIVNKCTLGEKSTSIKDTRITNNNKPEIYNFAKY